jgi:hypothetical protein
MDLAAHLAGELFKTEARIDLVHVPYKGAAPALQDVIAGHVQMMFATASSVVPHIKDGKVRALAVTTLKRSPVLPDIATIDELGIRNFDATTWHGLVAPSRTRRETGITRSLPLFDLAHFATGGANNRTHLALVIGLHLEAHEIQNATIVALQGTLDDFPNLLPRDIAEPSAFLPLKTRVRN